MEQEIVDGIQHPQAATEAMLPGRPPAPPPPPVSAASEPLRPMRGDLIPMRGFGPMPARLSPVMAGEIYVKAPSILRLDIKGGEFAFYPWDDAMSPFLGTRDLVYARHGAPVRGDLVFVMLADGRPRLGFVTEVGGHGIVLDANGMKIEIGPGEIVECASVILIHRNGRPETVVQVAPSTSRERQTRAA